MTSGRYTALLLPLCSFPVKFSTLLRGWWPLQPGPSGCCTCPGDRLRGFSDFCLIQFKCEWAFRPASVRIRWLPSNFGGPGPESAGILLLPDNFNDKLQHTGVNAPIKAVDQPKKRSRLGTVLEYYFLAQLGQLFRYPTVRRESDCDLPWISWLTPVIRILTM